MGCCGPIKMFLGPLLLRNLQCCPGDASDTHTQAQNALKIGAKQQVSAQISSLKMNQQSSLTVCEPRDCVESHNRHKFGARHVWCINYRGTGTLWPLFCKSVLKKSASLFLGDKEGVEVERVGVRSQTQLVPSLHPSWIAAGICILFKVAMST